jgi:protocatechuate 3,4-dioxygenase alpha subunit
VTTVDDYGETPSQTVGPFFHLGMPWPDGPYACTAGTDGAFWIRGRVLDGAGEPVPDAVLETWQADPTGRFGASGGFRGFARCETDAGGSFAIHTVKPGTVPDPDGAAQAPHIDVSVFARGLLDRLVTRIYFADEPATATDPVLARVGPLRRHTLVARPAADGYLFDVHLQGDDETVFFAV